MTVVNGFGLPLAMFGGKLLRPRCGFPVRSRGVVADVRNEQQI
jgi:hypothetical protein